MILKDIESLSDAEKLALVQAVQESVAANKAKQTTQEVGQYAKLVVDAIKKIKTDLEERYAAISADITVKAAAIKDGKDGLQGPKGEKGDTGLRGLDGANGKDGKDGKDGIDGVDGNGVADARIDFDGSLIITLDNGNEINAGEVVPMDVAEKIKVIGNGGGTSQYVLDAIADVQAQIDAISGGLVYKGTWNASTNTPTLASGTGTTNWYYVVSVAGSTDLDGITSWSAGDWVIYNGTAWQKIDQSWAQAGANSDITSMSGITGGITTPDYITFDVNPSTTPTAPGSLYWDSADGNQTLSLVMAGGTATQQIGEEQYFRIKASSAITNGQVVMFTGTVGASGALTGAPATGLTAANASYVMGIATQDIALNGWGYVTSFGLVRQLNTNAWAEGTILYYDPTVAGGLTSTIPTAPNAKVQVCAVIYQSAVNGSLFVRPAFGGVLGQYEGDVGLTSLAANDVLVRSSGNTVWENKAQSTLVAGNVSGTVAVANGGTGATTASGARTNLGLAIGTDVLAPNGSAASLTSFPTLNQNTTGNAATATLAASTPKLLTTNFTIEESGGKLLFKYGATTIASMSSTGVITSATNIVSNGTP